MKTSTRIGTEITIIQQESVRTCCKSGILLGTRIKKCREIAGLQEALAQRASQPCEGGNPQGIICKQEGDSMTALTFFKKYDY